jgi:hypothetical protein
MLKGGRGEMALELKVHRTMVDAVCRGEKRCPEAWCLIVERITTGGIQAQELRPDLVWVRVPCDEWPNPAGKPMLDLYPARINHPSGLAPMGDAVSPPASHGVLMN